MKNMKYILGLMIAMPFCAWAADANASDVGATTVPFGRIYDAVTSFTDLYETNFVKLLDNKPTYTLGDVAQACVNFTKYSNGKVNNKTCQDFMRSVIDKSNFIASTTVEDFVVTTTDNTTVFEFDIYASGDFYIDCDVDDTGSQIIKLEPNSHTVKCDYSGKSGQYKIKITGEATGYPDCTERNTKCSAISFWHNTNLHSIQGSLGSVFKTLSNGVQPKFIGTFDGCENLTGPIPQNLFAGISGQPVAHMFDATFLGCKKLDGEIPKGLFGKLSGAPAEDMFRATFQNCSGLEGEIPSGLFGELSGAPAEGMFRATFYGCEKLDGKIPSGLFGKLSGAPAEDMFNATFQNCSGLDGEIPKGLFGKLSDAPAVRMFDGTFYGCENLDGEIPSGLFGKLSGVPAKEMFRSTFNGCKNLDGKIPSGLFGKLSGAPAVRMFAYTFNGCENLDGEIPSGLFGELSGAPAKEMFNYTFKDCTNLSGPLAKSGEQFLHEIWPDASMAHIDGMYIGCTNLEGWSDIPGAWR